MNRKLGIYSSIVTLVAVLGFALSMIIGSDNGSFFSSIFIALGFLPMICAFASYTEKDVKGIRYTAVAFACVYAVLIVIVYYAQLTTVRLSNLNEQASQILDYKYFGLFFNYDLLGYGFMALSTFFASFLFKAENKPDKWLKALLRIHGVFSITCFIMPLLGMFKPGMASGDLIGIIILEFWCAYFTPVCILSYMHFKKIH